MARHHYLDDAHLHLLDPSFLGYPAAKTVHNIAGKPVDMPVAPFQYLETHDHSQLIVFVGIEPGDIQFGDRSKFSKLQPCRDCPPHLPGNAHAVARAGIRRKLRVTG